MKSNVFIIIFHHYLLNFIINFYRLIIRLAVTVSHSNKKCKSLSDFVFGRCSAYFWTRRKSLRKLFFVDGLLLIFFVIHQGILSSVFLFVEDSLFLFVHVENGSLLLLLSLLSFTYFFLSQFIVYLLQ
jgi:hypothetical protein